MMGYGSCYGDSDVTVSDCSHREEGQRNDSAGKDRALAEVDRNLTRASVCKRNDKRNEFIGEG